MSNALFELDPPALLYGGDMPRPRALCRDCHQPTQFWAGGCRPARDGQERYEYTLCKACSETDLGRRHHAGREIIWADVPDREGGSRG
ncbi:hypothetical protein [Microbacterium sp. AR7-10]|uniref:hypothetical protein n=1 Tax=Microbacterium sp. AR7-10 TaxID=1891970 RepID=UPI000AF29405|nr:hypothetical protein [Microbacterium sp. AR7-10]